MNDFFLTIILIGFCLFAAYGLTHPGWAKWKRTNVPVSPLGYIGGLIFVVSLGLLVVLQRHGFCHGGGAVIGFVSIAFTGWVIAAYAGLRDTRKGNRRDDPDAR